MENKLYIAILRRPGNKEDEKRSDPFWEFGSFGITGCHTHNLLNPKKAVRLKDSRIAFVQGGPEGFKLLLITPPVNYNLVDEKCEIIWEPYNLPFKYNTAPTIVKNGSQSNFNYIVDLVKDCNRTTDEGKFASAFRSKTSPLDKKVADKLLRDFEKLYKKAKPEDIISNYTETLPWPPPLPDKNRKKTYNQFKGNGHSGCKK
jgi:hypothetical protein